MKNIFLILLACLFMAGCVTRNKCNLKFPCIVENTIKYDTTYKDTGASFIIPADSSYVMAYFACDSLGNVYLQKIKELSNQRPKIKLEFRDKILYVEARIDSSSIYHAWKERYIKITEVKTPAPVRENYLTGWQWFQVWCGRIFWLLLILFLIYVVWRIWFKKPLK